MVRQYQPCIPTRGTKVPAGPDYEIKMDGYRLLVGREGKRVRLITRNGYDWTDRFPWIVEAALKNKQQRFVIDGEAVVPGVDAISDFNTLHSRKHKEEVQLYAFDILVLGGDDLRKLPLHLRKTNFHSSWRVAPMASQLRRSNEARSLRLFRHACPIGLEGMVCKHRDSPYRAGRQPHWIKVKNRKHPSLDRAKDGNW